MIYIKLRSNDMYTKKQNYGSLQVSDAGFIRVNSGWRHKKQFLEYYELLFVSKGNLYLNVSGREISVSENQIVVIPPYQTMAGGDESFGEVSFFWVDFYTDMADGLQMPRSFLPQTIHNPAQVMHLFTILCEPTPPEIMKTDIMDSALVVILYAIRREQQDIHSAIGIVNDVFGYVEDHITEQISADDVAAALNYNKDYINRLVHQRTGVTLKKYINKRKIETSKTLLRTSTYTIQEIAEQLGYTDGNLFTKYFIYHQKVSPTEYRQGVET